MLHRDLKPSNIILGKHGETLVVDWGLAKPLGRSDPKSDAGERTLLPSSGSGSEETLPGSTLGTPGYMSPEQARGDLNRVGPRSDIYSLGATLYCLLTGRPPFEGDDVASLLRKVQWGEFAAPAQLDRRDRPGTRSRLPEGDDVRAGGTLRDLPGPGRRHRALDCRPAGLGLARTFVAPSAAVGAAQPDRCRRPGRPRSLVAVAGSAYVRTVQRRAKADLTASKSARSERVQAVLNAVKSYS